MKTCLNIEIEEKTAVNHSCLNQSNDEAALQRIATFVGVLDIYEEETKANDNLFCG